MKNTMLKLQLRRMAIVVLVFPGWRNLIDAFANAILAPTLFGLAANTAAFVLTLYCLRILWRWEKELCRQIDELNK